MQRKERERRGVGGGGGGAGRCARGQRRSGMMASMDVRKKGVQKRGHKTIAKGNKIKKGSFAYLEIS